MLFNSLSYLLFLPAIYALFRLYKGKYRWVLLLAASYYFYASWNFTYLALILISTVVDYVAARLMERQEEQKARRKYLALSLVANLGLLFTFKYLDFALDNFDALLRQFGILYEMPSLNLLLPVGISFYTFQTLSYSIDVYHGARKAERHLGYFALYVCFFPQLVAGPIERSTQLLPQLRRLSTPSFADVQKSINQIVFGLVKKVVIADRIGYLIDPAFANVDGSSSTYLLIAAYGFAFQVYFDFSGYTDIAIGSARLFGVELSPNFKRPYLSQTISDFWRRWHITLMNWFRDYLYVPMTGFTTKVHRVVFSLLLVFFASGVWHGADWTFILWGAIHGTYMVFSYLSRRLTRKIDRAVRRTSFAPPLKFARIVFTFHLAAIASVFFRVATVADGWGVLRSAVWATNDLPLAHGVSLPGCYGPLVPTVFQFNLVFLCLAVGTLMAAEIFAELRPKKAKALCEWRGGWSVVTRWLLLYVAVSALVFFGKWDHGEFIYFQF